MKQMKIFFWEGESPTLKVTNEDFKISLYVCVHIKAIPWKFCILNPKNLRVICPWTF